MQLAIYQGAGQAGNPAANLLELESAAEQAASESADLLVLPELWLSGYNIGTTAHELAEEADGPAAERVGRIAAQHGLAILYGYPERAGNKVFNAARFIDDSGKPVANMRKAHLYGPDEQNLFCRGDTGFPLVNFRGLRIGIVICYDIEFPEVARTLALRGAELIAVPTSLPERDIFVATQVVPVRAWENQIFVAYANRCGQEDGLAYTGHSRICAPDGRVLAAATDGSAIITENIDPDCYNKTASVKNTYLQDRRPDLYQP